MRVSAGMKARFAVSGNRHRDQDSARRIEASRGIPTSLSKRASTAYIFEHAGVLIFAVMYVFAPVAVAQTGSAPLNQSQCSGTQMPCGSSSAPVGKGANHAETAPPDAALAEAKSLLQ